MSSVTERLDRDTADQLTASLHAVFTAAPDEPESALAELGWAEVSAADPVTATRLLFTEHGRVLARSRLLDDVVLAELASVLPPAPGKLAVLYPHPDDGSSLQRVGILLAPLQGIDEVVLPVTTGSGFTPLVVAADEVARAAVPVTGFDRGSRWLLVRNLPVPPGASTAGPDTAWADAVAAGRRALAAELIGISDAALALAVAHTTGREQYGRPIGSFQAVRHRLAESYVAIEAARSTLGAAESDGASWSAALAKRAAGQAQAVTLRAVVQVFGAMGLTAEGPVHRYVTRGAALDALLGGHQSLTEELGTALLGGADLDPVVAVEADE
ncbi:acyl-CoA dehydrogenase family protein [Cryptosporangium aurantiacum]|uniref:Acyl-CoA dehydrogenase, C-terminal domain n=1 Tax=Cryptosporangium aurantiacum TaxID=134849 RepID=A0A1M7PGN6_9ACTN|nr:acyl-CoA dehydrogenase family protein [Cryptosporangium aurantiacum]SHN16188.1 Acyl-CoA dehydrogenase, C-terminal domain [Cryptosporangium aurantiacum]